MTATVGRVCQRCGRDKPTDSFPSAKARVCLGCRLTEQQEAALKLTHEEWQTQAVQLLHALGWQHLHVRRTIGRGRSWTTSTNRTGWPDLFCWQPRRQRFAAIELKVAPDLPRDDQMTVLHELAMAGAATCVAYPADLDRLERMLRGVEPDVDGWAYEGQIARPGRSLPR